jgi:hypothetical protein
VRGRKGGRFMIVMFGFCYEEILIDCFCDFGEDAVGREYISSQLCKSINVSDGHYNCHFPTELVLVYGLTTARTTKACHIVRPS